MNDEQSLARVQETERLLMQAIQDVPLTATGPEVAAAVQSIGLKLAEGCMGPRDIARVLLNQAEGYMKAAGEITEAAIADEAPSGEMTEKAHRILTQAGRDMQAEGIPLSVGSHLMLGYSAAWVCRGDARSAAESLYRTADSMIGRDRKRATH